MTKMQEMMEWPERRRREGQRSVRFAFGWRSSLFCVSVLFLYLQGLSERMSKVKCLWKSQFSQKISFLNCFRSEISGKFMPYSIQVHQNHPVISLEAGASDMLSDCGWLAQADHWPETLSKDPNHVFKFPRGKISNINIFISIHTANFVLHKLKHQYWVFSQSLRSMVGLKQPITARKHIKGASF